MWPFPIGDATDRDRTQGRVRAGRGAEAADLARLLHAAAGGDQGAFAAFYDRTVGLAIGVAVRVLRNRMLAEEVTQEVFVELWRLAPRYDDSKGSPQAWVTTLTHRRAVDRVRAEQAARHRDDRDGRQRLGADRASGDGVADEVVDRLDRERVGAALQELTTQQREALTMAYYGGHTYRRIAELLGVPEGTIKTRIRDGLTRLRSLMEAAT